MTEDALFGGHLRLFQPARGAGYRVNVDAILLAAFAARMLDGGAPRGRRARNAVDLGSGVGGVGLSLLHFDAAASVTMVEMDATLAELARKNAEANGWESRIAVENSDVAKATVSGADLVVCNPPYVARGRGRPPSPHRRAARWDDGAGSLDRFVTAARKASGQRARVCFIYPAIEGTTLLMTLRARGLEPKRIRAVHGKARESARVLLVEAVGGKPGGLVVEPPFVEFEGHTRTPALDALLAG